MEAVFQFFGFGPKRFDARDGFSFRPFLKVSSMACSICRSILSLSMGTCRPRKRGRAGTPLCVLLFQYCLLSFLPPSTSCLDHRGFAAPPRPALFRDSRSTAWAFVNGFGVCRRQNAMKTVMNREEYWGKKQAGAWERDLELKESKITPGGIICHPCAHLAWSTNIPTDPAQHELLNVGELSEPPGVVDFKRVSHPRLYLSHSLSSLWPLTPREF
eukprot:843461-Rhodomonas_salina.2